MLFPSRCGSQTNETGTAAVELIFELPSIPSLEEANTRSHEATNVI